MSALSESLRVRMPVPRRPLRFPPRPDRSPATTARLRAAVTALFVLDGAVFGSWASRVPDVAATVGAGHTALGVALLCLSLGALVCMRVTGSLCARFGAGPVAAVAAVLVSLTAALPGLVSTVAGAVRRAVRLRCRHRDDQRLGERRRRRGRGPRRPAAAVRTARRVQLRRPRWRAGRWRRGRRPRRPRAPGPGGGRGAVRLRLGAARADRDRASGSCEHHGRGDGRAPAARRPCSSSWAPSPAAPPSARAR